MVLVPSFINAQSITDAINWSFENESGNSRYESMAGAFGALGGNLSAVSNNPASGAVFELSRFGVSLIVNNNSTESIYKNDHEGLIKTEVRKYNPGQVCAADEPDIHKISNDEVTNLVNLHLYSPPLNEFNIYEG